jgi:hypothetical protein
LVILHTIGPNNAKLTTIYLAIQTHPEAFNETKVEGKLTDKLEPTSRAMGPVCHVICGRVIGTPGVLEE